MFKYIFINNLNYYEQILIILIHANCILKNVTVIANSPYLNMNFPNPLVTVLLS